MSELMRVLTREEGVVTVEVTAPVERSMVGSYWNAVRDFLETGEVERLGQFDGVRIGRGHWLTDPDELEAWAAQGELEFEDIYDSTGR
jgi:hypothetical protein